MKAEVDWLRKKGLTRLSNKQMLAHTSRFEEEESLPTVRTGDLALTATRAKDEASARAQVARRQPDGSWLRVLDRPDFRG